MILSTINSVLGVQNTLSQLEFDHLPFGCDLGAQITLPHLDLTTFLLFVPQCMTCAAALDCIRL